MLKTFSLTLLTIIIFSSFKAIPSDDIQKKIIRSQGFDIECYVSLKKEKSFHNEKVYYWFKSGAIHNSLAASGGLLLHSSFTKHYKSNQLAEKGEFHYGVKNGSWKEWYENGKIKRINSWKKGVKNGLFSSYDSLGNMIEKGYYKNNLKVNTWINYKTKDTIHYQKGNLIIKDSLNKKEGFFKRIFKKKDSTSKIKSKPKKIKEEKPKKDNFFKRLFKKKEREND